jgi:hypothetical protein
VRWHKDDQSPAVLAELAALRAKSPEEFLERVYRMNYSRPHVGFKIMKGQFKGVFTSVLEDRSIKKVVLFRRNILANYSSRLIASESGKYVLKRKDGGSENSGRPEVTFDPDDFDRFARRYARYYKRVITRIQDTRQELYVINYEEINDIIFYRILLNYIGADCSQVQADGKLLKQNPSDILSRFSNRDVAEAFLREHNLLHWAYEGEVMLERTAVLIG